MSQVKNVKTFITSMVAYLANRPGMFNGEII